MVLLSSKLCNCFSYSSSIFWDFTWSSWYFSFSIESFWLLSDSVNRKHMEWMKLIEKKSESYPSAAITALLFTVFLAAGCNKLQVEVFNHFLHQIYRGFRLCSYKKSATNLGTSLGWQPWQSCMSSTATKYEYAVESFMGGLLGTNLQYSYLGYKSGIQVFPGCVHLLAELNDCTVLAQWAVHKINEEITNLKYQTFKTQCPCACSHHKHTYGAV